MKLEDIDFYSEKYDLQRDLEWRKCIKIWDYDTLFIDLQLCEDFDEIDIMFFARKSKGGMNPKEIKKRLDLCS